MTIFDQANSLLDHRRELNRQIDNVDTDLILLNTQYDGWSLELTELEKHVARQHSVLAIKMHSTRTRLNLLDSKIFIDKFLCR